MFVANPNLPNNQITEALIDIQSSAAMYLRECGVKLIDSAEEKRFNYPIRKHSDAQVHHVGGNAIFLYSKSDLKQPLLNTGFHIREIGETPSPIYEKECFLNVLSLENKLFCNPITTSQDIIKYYSSNKYSIINVSQGYTKCSSVVVDKNSVITDDESLFKALQNENLNVLKISQGDIILPGYKYGFMGGSCGKISSDILLFNGDISIHKDYDAIYSFCRNIGVKVEFIKNQPLEDIGGIIPLKEKFM
jgi:hypothetical protein